MRTKGRGLKHLSTYVKTSLFARIFYYFHAQGTFVILCCLWRRLSLLFYKTFGMITFLSLKCSTVFFSMELLISCLKTFSLEMGGGEGQMGRSRYAMGGRSKRTCTYDGERGSNSSHFGTYLLNE